MRLSHRDFDALQHAVPELYKYRDLADFKEAIPRIFLNIIPAEHFALFGYEIHPATRRARMVERLESGPRLSGEAVACWEERFWEHPFTRYFLSGGEMTALMFSDFFTSAQLRNSVLW